MACAVDTDCPGAMLCYAVAPQGGANATSMCACSGWYGRYGPECDEITPYFVAQIAAIGGTVCHALVLTVMALRDIVTASRLPGGLRATATHVTLVLTGLALASLFLWKLMYLFEFLVPMKYVMDVEDTGSFEEKFSTFREWAALALVSLETVVTPSLLSLSLMWIEASKRSMELNFQLRRRINWYRRVTYVVAFIMFIGAALAVATHQYWLVALVAPPAGLVLAVAFVLGRRGMEQVARVVASLRDPQLQESAARNMARIRRCTRKVLFWTCAVTLTNISWFVLFIVLSDWRTLSVAGVGCWPMLSYELVSLSLLHLLRTEYLYCHEDLVNRQTAITSVAATTTAQRTSALLDFSAAPSVASSATAAAEQPRARPKPAWPAADT